MNKINKKKGDEGRRRERGEREEGRGERGEGRGERGEGRGERGEGGKRGKRRGRGLLYVEVSISSGNSATVPTKRVCTSERTSLSS